MIGFNSYGGGVIMQQNPGSVIMQQNGGGTIMKQNPHSIHHRREHQSQRIQNGLADGSLNTQEMGELKGMRQDFRQEIRADRASGGGLDPQERQQLQGDLDKMSGAIYAFRHDGN